MKSLTWNRWLSMLLCIIMALSLTACGNKTSQAPVDGKGSVNVTIEDNDEQDDDALQNDDELAEQSLAWLRSCMVDNEQYTGAVCYLGYREPGETLSLQDWLLENHEYLVDTLPFLLAIPDECVLGPGHGDLYCVVPRDENTSLAVNHVTWQTVDYGVWPVADDVLYREECAQPVFLYSNYEEWPDEPDVEINLVTNEGATVTWCPLADESGWIIAPTGENYAPMLMDFSVFGDPSVINDPNVWNPLGDASWLPPTNEGLANTTWVYGDWMLDLAYGNCDPAYAGIAKLYNFAESTNPAFHGVWRMNGDCLELEMSAGVGTSLSGCFPICISPSGEEMYFHRSSIGGGMPFLPYDMDAVYLTYSYG